MLFFNGLYSHFFWKLKPAINSEKVQPWLIPVAKIIKFQNNFLLMSTAGLLLLFSLFILLKTKQQCHLLEKENESFGNVFFSY